MSDSTYQDWEPVVVRNSAAARDSEKKPVARSASVIAAAKIENSDGPVRIKTFSSESVRILQDYRRENTLTQKDLDRRCSFPSNTTNLLESRKAGPTVGQLRALNQLLKTGLTLE